MKATRNLAIAAVMLAMAAALLLVSLPAFADTIEGSGVPDAPAADSGESGGSDNGPAIDANGMGGGAAEPGDAATGSLTVGAPTTPTVGENAPAATEPGVLAGGIGGGDGNGTDNGEPVVIDGESGNKGKGSGSYSAVKGGPVDGNNAYEDGGDGFDGNSTNAGSEEDKSIDGKKAGGAGDGLENGGKAGDNGELGDGTEKKVGEEQPIVEIKGMQGVSGNNSVAGAIQGAGVAGTDESNGTDEGEYKGKASDSDGNSQGGGALESENNLMSAAGSSGAPMTLLAANDGSGASSDGLRSTQVANTTELLGEEGELNIALLLVEGAISGSASGATSWSAGKILTAIFGSNMAGDADAKLDSILQSLAEIQTELQQLKKTVDAQELENLLNSMKPLIESNKPHIALTDLASLDAAGYSEAEYKERLKSVLTEGLSNGTLTDFGSLAGTDNTFDLFCTDLWRAMTTTYSVTINDKSQEITLMQVYYERLRLKYNWEHQAYAEWEEFNTRCVSLLASTLSLERASLKMRLELLREYNSTHTDKHDEGGVIALLNDTQDQINQLKGYIG
ncbi:MAG: hypothetical protein J5804_03685, partial [Eggerthellaceae bacterium]|nr:hypothetical protein [Eggerthellaceae bacterium]